jgi:hypothetical protein
LKIGLLLTDAILNPKKTYSNDRFLNEIELQNYQPIFILKRFVADKPIVCGGPVIGQHTPLLGKCQTNVLQMYRQFAGNLIFF